MPLNVIKKKRKKKESKGNKNEIITLAAIAVYVADT